MDHRLFRRPVDGTITSARVVQAPLFVLGAAFLLLALLPVFTQRRIASALDDLSERLDPARAALADMQLALAQEAAGTRGFLLTGEDRYAADHQRARAVRKMANASLTNLSGTMASDYRTAMAAIARELGQADELLDALYAGELTREQYLDFLPVQHARFEQVIAAIRRLQDVVNRDAAARRESIRTIHRVDAIITFAGVVLAFATITAVTGLSFKYRSLAERERNARAASETARAEADRRREETMRLSASRERLIRGFSHDLRNPLGAADSYLYMLEEGLIATLTPNQKDAVSRSRRSLKTAIQLIQDLLDLARADTGDIELRFVPTDLREVAARAVEDYRAQAQSKGLQITTDFPDTLPSIQSDPARIAQILSNLLSNAIKYTKAGGVRVRVATRRYATGIECCVVDVIDSGPGIAREHQALIFEEFTRLTERESGGAGIGLAISRRLSALLGGRLDVESEPGRGATFTLSIPVSAH